MECTHWKNLVGREEKMLNIQGSTGAGVPDKASPNKAFFLGLCFWAWIALGAPEGWACTVTSATLQASADDDILITLNGNVVVSQPSNCNWWQNVSSFPITNLSWINGTGENILAVYGADQCGNDAWDTWLLTINYSDCPTQYIQSDGWCTRVLDSGVTNTGSGFQLSAF